MRHFILFGCLLLATSFQGACNTPTPTTPSNNTKPTNARQTLAIEGIQLPIRDAKEVRASPNASVTQAVGHAMVRLDYGRPGIKGRKIFGGLEEYGKVWRAGANEATTFLNTQDILVNGQKLPKGIYAFFLIPTENEWTAIFNRNADQWGSFSYNKGLDQLRLSIKAEKGAVQEWLSYSFEDLTENSAKLILAWDTVRIPLNVQVAKSEQK